MHYNHQHGLGLCYIPKGRGNQGSGVEVGVVESEANRGSLAGVRVGVGKTIANPTPVEFALYMALV